MCLSETVLGKHAQSLLLSEDLLVLLPCGPCFSKQLRHPKSPDLTLPYSEGLVVQCALTASLHSLLAGGSATAWLSLEVQSQGSQSPSAEPGRASILTRESLSVLGEETALVILGPWDAKGRVQ